ncbi:hypothetical protein JCM6882_002675 [Rhodosporidiobolus microsporus]
MESTGRAEPTDRLSTLPVELLEWIFELAYEDGENTMTGAISRALLVFDRKERFKRIEVKGVEQLLRFRELVEGSAHLHALLGLLVFDECDTARQGQPPHPTSEQMQRLFTLLTRIRRIDLRHNCNNLHNFLLSPASAGAFPTFLSEISLRPSDCSLSRLSNLNAFPSVTQLSLRMDECYRSTELVASAAESTYHTLPHITRLVLREEYLDLDSTTSIVESCTNLEALTLNDPQNEPDFEPFLPRLPITLNSLSLLTITCFDDWSNPCDHHLLRLSQLTSLTLGEGTFDHSTLFNNLRALPTLTRLTFNRGAIVSASDLLSLVSGPLRHPSLTGLTLDMLTIGERGWRIQEDGEGQLHPEHAKGKKHAAPDWVVPEFTDPDERFSTSGVEGLVSAGERNGVKVVGSAVEGVEVYRDWRVEVVECLLVYGGEKGNYGELREFVGDEEAEKLLQTRMSADGRLS